MSFYFQLFMVSKDTPIQSNSMHFRWARNRLAALLLVGSLLTAMNQSSELSKAG